MAAAAPIMRRPCRIWRPITAISPHAAPTPSTRIVRLRSSWNGGSCTAKNLPDLPTALAALQAEIYRLPSERFMEHARLRAEAMDLRDGKGSSITEADWQRIGELLDASWKSLRGAISEER